MNLSLLYICNALGPGMHFKILNNMARTVAVALPIDSVSSNMSELCLPLCSLPHLSGQSQSMLPLSTLYHSVHKPHSSALQWDLLNDSEPFMLPAQCRVLYLKEITPLLMAREQSLPEKKMQLPKICDGLLFCGSRSPF